MISTYIGRTHGLSALAIGVAAILSACGGGGGAPGPGPGPDLTPSSVTASNFSVASEYQSNGSTSSNNLQVVDLRTGQVALTLDTPSSTGANIWGTSLRYAVTGATSAKYQGLSQLFFVQSGGIQQRDLRGNTVGSPKVISSLNSVCGIAGTHEINAEGSEGWLEVSTGGTDSNCSTTTDNDTRLVPFNAATTDGGKLMGSKGLTWVDDIRPDLSSATVGILAVDRNTGKLNLYSTDLSRVISNVALGRTLGSSETAEVIYSMPAAPDRLLMRVGSSLYLASLSGTTLTMGAVLRTLQSSTSIDSVTDGVNLYLADGADLDQITPTGSVRTVATVDTTKGSVNRVLYSGGSLIVTQTSYYTNTNTNPNTSTVTAYRVDTGAATPLASSTADNYSWALLARDGKVWILDASYTTRMGSLTQMSVDGSNPLKLVTGAMLVDVLVSPDVSLASGMNEKRLLWCQAATATSSCAGAELHAYELSTGNIVNLGTIPADAGWAVYDIYSMDLSMDGRPNLLALSQSSSSGTLNSYKTSTLWYDPSKPGSLRTITALP